MNDNMFLAFIILLCLASCDNSEGVDLVDAIIDRTTPKECAC